MPLPSRRTQPFSLISMLMLTLVLLMVWGEGSISPVVNALKPRQRFVFYRRGPAPASSSSTSLSSLSSSLDENQKEEDALDEAILCSQSKTASCQGARGGGVLGNLKNQNKLSSAAQVLQGFFDRDTDKVKPAASSSSTSSLYSSSSSKAPPTLHPSFEIHGWRWHTLAIIRESKRLSRALRLYDANVQDPASLHKAASFIVQFSMKGLHQTESKLFFPWLKSELPYYFEEKNNRENRNGPALQLKAQTQEEHNQNQSHEQSQRQFRQALYTVVSQLESQQKMIQQLGGKLMKTMSTLSESSSPSQKKKSRSRTTTARVIAASSSLLQEQEEQEQLLWSSAADNAAQIAKQTQDMLELQQSVLIPLIGQLVPTQAQVAFNQLVIRELGVWNSRLHLVSFHQVFYGNDSGRDLSTQLATNERTIFAKSIPRIAQRMIPRWKRLLYDPQMAALEEADG